MTLWLINLFVHGGIVATATVGLLIHLRLVKFFDLTWAIWAMACALSGVITTRSTGSAFCGIAAAGVIGALMGALQDGLLLRKVLIGHVPRDVIERMMFTAALAIYIALTSLAEVCGFRDREMIASTNTFWMDLSAPQRAILFSCWASLLGCFFLRKSSLAAQCRALIDDSSVCLLYGFPVGRLLFTTGAVAGALTGIAAGSYGVLYRAQNATGMELMLIAAVPCILVGLKSGVAAVVAAIGTVSIHTVLQVQLGYDTAEFLFPSAILVLLIARPLGLSTVNVRDV